MQKNGKTHWNKKKLKMVHKLFYKCKNVSRVKMKAIHAVWSCQFATDRLKGRSMLNRHHK